jgi:hypothetical protein
MKHALRFSGLIVILIFAAAAWPQAGGEVSGTVTSVEAGNAVVVLEGGRRIGIGPTTVILTDGQPVAVTALTPGQRVVIRQGQVLGDTVTVQAPGATVTVEVPRQTIIVEQQAPQITVQQPPPEVVVKPAPAPQAQVVPPPAPVAPPARAHAFPPPAMAVPYAVQYSENRYVPDAVLDGRPAGRTQVDHAVIALAPAGDAPAASVGLDVDRPGPWATGRPPWHWCDDSGDTSRYDDDLYVSFSNLELGMCQAP